MESFLEDDVVVAARFRGDIPDRNTVFRSPGGVRLKHTSSLGRLGLVHRTEKTSGRWIALPEGDHIKGTVGTLNLSSPDE